MSQLCSYCERRETDSPDGLCSDDCRIAVKTMEKYKTKKPEETQQ